MMRYLLKSLLVIPLIMFIANMIGYMYAFILGPIQANLNQVSSIPIDIPPVIPSYLDYLGGFFHLDFGTLPNGSSVSDTIQMALLASTGLLVAALVLSVIFGIALGRAGVRSDPPAVSGWITLLGTVGQSSPSFYVGILLISGSIFYVLWGPGNGAILLPFQGFGWDAHMIIPVLALMVRPCLQIAQTTASLLSEELGKQYVVALQGFGFSQRSIRRRFAFRSILAFVIQIIAGSWRLLIVELIILERLFNWPGIGKLFSSTLILTSHSSNYLFPPLLAALLSVLVFLFMISDVVASVMARLVDPRLSLS